SSATAWRTRSPPRTATGPPGGETSEKTEPHDERRDGTIKTEEDGRKKAQKSQKEVTRSQDGSGFRHVSFCAFCASLRLSASLDRVFSAFIMRLSSCLPSCDFA